MEKIENVTCIKFEDKIRNQHQEPFLLDEAVLKCQLDRDMVKISKKDYIEFEHGRSCHSFIGRQGLEQEIVLSRFCEEQNVIHEVYFVSNEP